MKHLKKLAFMGAVVLVVGVTSITALAASSYHSPAEIVAGLTGKSAESVTAEKMETGDTYGSLADKYGVLDQFRAQMLEEKRTYLNERVADGTMTQERADAIITSMENHQADCDGTSSGGTGARMGAKFGNMNGSHNGGGRNGSGYGSISGCGLGISTGN